MPCNYKAPASQAAFDNFAHAFSGSYINDISGSQLNSLYDALVWSPPLPHTQAEEERNKRNLLAWIARNHPELSNPGQRMPTKAILDASMQLRTSNSDDVAGGALIRHDSHQNVDRLEQNVGTGHPNLDYNNVDEVQQATADHRRPTRASLLPPARISTRRKSRASLPPVTAPAAAAVRPAMSAEAMDSLMQDVESKMLPASPTPKPRSRKAKQPLAIHEDSEGFSDDAGASVWQYDFAQTSASQPQSPNPSDFEDDEADFSDSCDKARDNTIHNWVNINNNKKKAASSSSKIASDPPTSQPATAQTNTSSSSSTSNLTQALIDALDRNMGDVHQKCHAKDLDSAIQSLATMMSLVVMVRDSGFHIEE
ncbi:uncharacterized protein MYCFIDRAFT_200799 [Pseudocercospora fijiensis CIRAD86]|uniref:Uncharacterized protein n=1 Tax=Pseudocercospora fijiensis (strain CIRAD86) TaxID=383855 RepID=M2ZYD6_PSEFD|nr:uncharacterized protein MYCFIDRAFT_200799 [Pseudocercospora fijiensis CIRAD86]EME77126.1 hypothetical protein MYCFIDRAFT_200799 [Pseudocercospora fijiensis CIRAD86]